MDRRVNVVKRKLVGWNLKTREVEIPFFLIRTLYIYNAQRIDLSNSLVTFPKKNNNSLSTFKTLQCMSISTCEHNRNSKTL